MALSLSSGQEVSVQDWIDLQVDLASNWNMRSVEGLSKADVVTIWIRAFAGVSRTVCDMQNVPVDVFEAKMSEFIDFLTSDVCVHKHLLSEQAHRDVGLHETLSNTRIFPDVLVDDMQEDIGAEIYVVFPHIDAPEELTARRLELARAPERIPA